ncbi:acyl-CoA dehydrogenase [Paenibacillus agaridevorans]|uniref:Acyl-CoA dehydrogenase n=1 Tax=Paenibacillus agaridevorans TaxID=171404 RepID=A0A2R5F6V4_9BACL|nr:acyl-CoA dehydrogenase family protein [Paenibacillus agaridevorans]GBG12381.1 acyl-CoA dehydrogenase [Paenibacillus agaridevorans]
MSRYIDQFVRNEEERLRVEKVERLAAKFVERAARHDEEASFPFDNFADLREAGYLKLTVPAEYGGDGIDLHGLVLLQERLAYGDGSTALAVGWHVGQVFHYRESGKWQQKLFAELCRSVVRDGTMINTFASEASTGSPSRGGRPETIAVRSDGGWRLTGRKTFSTLSPILDRFVVSAYIPEEAAVSEFLVMKSENVTLVETWNSLGMRATGSHDVILDGAFVPSEHRIAGGGIDDGSGWLLHIPACYMGIALAARDYALEFARTYQPNYTDKPIASFPAVQASIGEMELALRSARTVLFAAADRWDKEPDNRPALKPELGLAKHVTTNNAIRVVDLAMRIVGGSSLSRSLPLERYYRDVRAGLHNPPMDGTVIQNLASSALSDGVSS